MLTRSGERCVVFFKIDGRSPDAAQTWEESDIEINYGGKEAALAAQLTETQQHPDLWAGHHGIAYLACEKNWETERVYRQMWVQKMSGTNTSACVRLEQFRSTKRDMDCGGSPGTVSGELMHNGVAGNERFPLSEILRFRVFRSLRLEQF